MRNAGRLIDILDRMESGPVMEETEFDLTIIAKRTQQLVKEYEILFDGEDLIKIGRAHV